MVVLEQERSSDLFLFKTVGLGWLVDSGLWEEKNGWKKGRTGTYATDHASVGEIFW